MSNDPIIGIIGGSGFSELRGLTVEHRVQGTTSYGDASDEILVGRFGDKASRVAFLPRHGSKHHLLPHEIPYRANLAALASCGANVVIATCICGSLTEAIEPGTHVVLDQLINFTTGRDSFRRPGRPTDHLAFADPYCPQLREAAIAALSTLPMVKRDHGTVVVVNGPRFGTRAEGRMFAALGGEAVNMTQYPEVLFAREQGMCYAGLAAITDYDAGIAAGAAFSRSGLAGMLKVFDRVVDEQQTAVQRIVENLSPKACDECAWHPDPYYRMS